MIIDKQTKRGSKKIHVRSSLDLVAVLKSACREQFNDSGAQARSASAEHHG